MPELCSGNDYQPSCPIQFHAVCPSFEALRTQVFPRTTRTTRPCLSACSLAAILDSAATIGLYYSMSIEIVIILVLTQFQQNIANILDSLYIHCTFYSLSYETFLTWRIRPPSFVGLGTGVRRIGSSDSGHFGTAEYPQ